MLDCGPSGTDQFRCPTKWELWTQILALLPRGRAWQSHEDVGEWRGQREQSQLGVYELGRSGLGTAPDPRRLTVLQQFWAAYAEVLEDMHQRACALLAEMVCSTTVELLPEWGRDYGFPDACEPWDSLCEKVVSIGGASCAWLTDMAARRGWTINCIDCGAIGADSGSAADCDAADCAVVDCHCPDDTIFIEVDLAASPAYVAPSTFASADLAVADCSDTCDPDVSSLICLIERIKPAHVRAIYSIAH